MLKQSFCCVYATLYQLLSRRFHSRLSYNDEQQNASFSSPQTIWLSRHQVRSGSADLFYDILATKRLCDEKLRDLPNKPRLCVGVYGFFWLLVTRVQHIHSPNTQKPAVALAMLFSFSLSYGECACAIIILQKAAESCKRHRYNRPKKTMSALIIEKASRMSFGFCCRTIPNNAELCRA